MNTQRLRYAAGSALFILGSLTLLAQAKTLSEVVAPLVFLCGSILFLVGTLGKNP